MLSDAEVTAEDDRTIKFLLQLLQWIGRVEPENFTSTQQARGAPKACFFRGVDRLLRATPSHGWRRPFYGLGGGSTNGRAKRSAR